MTNLSNPINQNCQSKPKELGKDTRLNLKKRKLKDPLNSTKSLN